jgi:hypothetical protein
MITLIKETTPFVTPDLCSRFGLFGELACAVRA